MNSAEPKMGTREWVMLLILAVVWGGAFYFYKILDDAGIPPFTIVLGRVGVAGLVLLPILFATGRKLPMTRAAWGAFLLLGALNNLIPFTLIILGEKQIDSGLASVFNATTPIFTAIIAQVLLRDERLMPHRIAGIILGIVGVALLMGPSSLRGFNPTSLAQLACIGAAVVYGFGAVAARGVRRLGLDPLVLSTGQFCASTLVALPLALTLEHPWTIPVPAAGVGLAWLGLAIPSTALAYILYYRIIATAGATNAASVTFLVPVSALLLGTFALGERIAPTTIAGMAVIFAGVALLDGRLLNRFRTLVARRA